MPEHSELRVHGVSGSPPREILYTDPVTNDPPTDYTRLFRLRKRDNSKSPDGTDHSFEPTAFHWGGLTSGHWATAFWILLSPFAFANVAGWMSSRPNRWSHMAVRLSSLALTAIFVVQLGYVFIAVPAVLNWGRWPLVGTVLAYVVGFVGVVVLWLSTQSHFDKKSPLSKRLRLTFHPSTVTMLDEVADTPESWKDPAGSGLLAAEMWTKHPILHRLRRLHLATGLLAISTLLAVGLELGWLRYAAMIGFGLIIIVTIATTLVPTVSIVKVLTAWAPIAALLLAAVGIGALAVVALPAHGWPNINTVTFVLGIALGIAGLATAVSGLLSLGAITLGTLFGGSLGIGAVLLVEQLGGIATEDSVVQQGAGWVAVAMLFLLFTLVATALVLSFFKTDTAPERDGGVMAVLRRVTVRARIVFITMAGFGLATGILAIRQGCVFDPLDCDPALLSVPIRGGLVYDLASLVAAILVVGLVVRILILKPKPAAVAATLIGGGVAGWFIWLFYNGRAPSADVDYNDLVAISTLVIILIPTGFIVKSLAQSLLTKATNRKVGIVWDLASFWPRWFHPLAPPAYGPKVVEDLRAEVSKQNPTFLEAHSQGSIIALVTLGQMSEIPTDMTLITYGSPLGILYPKLFPKTGVAPLICEIDARVGGRWRNLWRDTDPLGGAPIGLAAKDVLVPEGKGHSGYERTVTFRTTRMDLIE